MKRPPSDFPANDPEARLTALLLGELDPAEAAELREELVANPVLREQHDRLAETVGLLRANLAPANGAVPATLPAKQRGRLLRTLGKSPKPVVPVVPLPAVKTPWWRVAVPLGLAAGITLTLGMLALKREMSHFMLIEKLGSAEATPFRDYARLSADAKPESLPDLRQRPRSVRLRSLGEAAAAPQTATPTPPVDFYYRAAEVNDRESNDRSGPASASAIATPPPAAPVSSFARDTKTGQMTGAPKDAASAFGGAWHGGYGGLAGGLGGGGGFGGGGTGGAVGGEDWSFDTATAGEMAPQEPTARSFGVMRANEASPDSLRRVPPPAQTPFVSAARPAGGPRPRLAPSQGATVANRVPALAKPAAPPIAKSRKSTPAPRMDRLMMERYGLLPAGEAKAAPTENEATAGFDVSALAVTDGRTRGRTQPRSSGGPRFARKGIAPSAGTAAVKSNLARAAGGQAGAKAYFADQTRVPVLGDVPLVGRLFSAIPTEDSATVTGEDGKVADAEAELVRHHLHLDLLDPVPDGKVADAEEELAPLPLKLPIPAFMGTPTDMSIATGSSPVPSHAGRRRPAQVPSAPALKQPMMSAGKSVERLAETAEFPRGLKANKSLAKGGRADQLQTLNEADKSKAAAKSAKQSRLRNAVTPEALELQEAKKESEQLAVRESRRELRRPETEAKKTKVVEDLAQRVSASPPAGPLPEILTADNPFSTFSLNVTDVSFKLAAASLDQGRMPEPGRIRSEEFVNAFDYRDPEPTPGQRVGFVWERARFPFAHNREVLRFALKTAAQGRAANRPLNLVLLLDSSGSMERADRVQIVRNALAVLGQQLRPNDRLSVVTFSSQPNLRADGVTGILAQRALQRATEVPPEGGTNLEEAMKLAYAAAERNFLAHGINRVVVLTDGAANLGDVSPERLQTLVESNRQKGIAFDAFGVGWEGYNDNLLEVLTRHGDGRYGFLNTPEEAATGFAQQLAGALQVAAADVKVQVEFNPARVARYRQIGYRQHRLTKEQFRDNSVDAAEIGAAEAGNALYIVETNPNGQGPIGHLRARYRVPETGQYEEREWLLDYRGPAPRLADASPALRLATSAAEFAEWLAGSPYAAGVKPDELLRLIRDVPPQYPRDPRPAQLQQMIQQARSIQGL